VSVGVLLAPLTTGTGAVGEQDIVPVRFGDVHGARSPPDRRLRRGTNTSLIRPFVQLIDVVMMAG
jgi:hypothetical protein